MAGICQQCIESCGIDYLQICIIREGNLALGVARTLGDAQLTDGAAALSIT